MSASQKQEQNTNTSPQHHKMKWATFTYIGEETRKNDTQFNIAFRMQSNAQYIETTPTNRRLHRNT